MSEMEYQKALTKKLNEAINSLEETLELVKSQDKFFGLAWPLEGRLWKLQKTCEQVLREI